MAAETPHAIDAGHAAEAASGGLPQFDLSTWSSQIFWLVVTFGLLYFVLAKFILPRIGEGISERGDRIADDLDAASRMQKEADQASVTYDRVMAAAKAKAHNIAETTRKSVTDGIEKDIEAAEAEFAKKQEVADERITASRNAAMAHVDVVAAETVEAIVGKIGALKPTATQIKSAIAASKG